MTSPQQPNSDPEYPPGASWPREQHELPPEELESYLETEQARSGDHRLVIYDPENMRAWITADSWREWERPEPVDAND